MTNFDTDISPTSPRALTDIAAWVKEVGDAAESHALEAKSTLNFTDKAQRKVSYAKIIKFIIGSANRDEFTAAKLFNGYGIMLIGVEQGNTPGIQDAPEQHEFDDYARKYFGSHTPTYEFKTHQFEDKTLLFILVDPPINGKAIYICSTDFFPSDREARGDALFDGAIYYRNSTQTKPAESAQLRAIINRLIGGNSNAELTLSPHIVNYCADGELTAEFYANHARIAQEEAESAIKGAKQHPMLAGQAISSFYAKGTSNQDKLDAAKNYQENIAHCLERLFELTLPSTLFSITNTGTKALESPTIEYTFPVNVLFLTPDEDAAPEDITAHEIWPHAPEPLKPFGIGPISPYKPYIPTGFTGATGFTGGTGIDKPTSIIWKPGAVSPGETITSHGDPAGIMVFHAPEDTITIRWRITDPSLSSPLTGMIQQNLLTIGNVEQLYSLVRRGRKIS